MTEKNFFKLKKGFNINLKGKAEEKIGPIRQSETFSIKPTDFQNVSKIKLFVQEKDQVKSGTPLFCDKTYPSVNFTAPVSGEVIEIKRGEKRKLLEVKILADKTIEYEPFEKFHPQSLITLSQEKVLETMTKSGLWLQLIQRPYGIIADPQKTPKSIFISTFDTSPLAPNYGFILKKEEEYFHAGVNILKKLLSPTGKIHVNLQAHSEQYHVFTKTNGVVFNEFMGPHPSGNVGVQIHHISPIKKGECVWTINPVGVVQIGKLFLEGMYDASRTIAVTGSEIKAPQYYKTYQGACLQRFIENNLKNDNVRIISGNVLTGEDVGKSGHLGFFDHQITVIPEGNQTEFLGWLKPTLEKLSFHKAFGLMSFLRNNNNKFVLNTNTRGEHRAFVQTGVLERVLPMDIYITYILKNILAEDYDQMEQLGIYELLEEDVALCEFVDVSKNNIQQMLRDGLQMLQNS
ncbi:MAG: Na(+)-translocating NADH-quinone reductase subunit A [Chitinophagaceae bacterium]|nr:Na(+)-translocating NADH-quinone reductase subunit A [Chitinophagaceae bacterium]